MRRKEEIDMRILGAINPALILKNMAGILERKYQRKVDLQVQWKETLKKDKMESL